MGETNYSTHKYWLKHGTGSFAIETMSDVAKIIDSGDDWCEVEIITGRKGRFTLSCLLENNEETTLEVEIKSL